MMEILM